jgi:hypothetical protein
MNGKIILLILVCINITSYVFGAICIESGTTCGSTSNPLVSAFAKVPTKTNSEQLSASGVAFSQSDNYSRAITDFNNQQPATEGSGISAIASFIDIMKMLVSFIALLTPLPVYFLLAGFGLPFVMTLLLMLPISILYLIAVAEFVGGRTF